MVQDKYQNLKNTGFSNAELDMMLESILTDTNISVEEQQLQAIKKLEKFFNVDTD